MIHTKRQKVAPYPHVCEECGKRGFPVPTVPDAVGVYCEHSRTAAIWAPSVGMWRAYSPIGGEQFFRLLAEADEQALDNEMRKP